MAQKDRNKQFWLIPKRSNLHQTICLIDGIVERNYDKTSWNEQKQNSLGVNLKKWGATRDGKNISNQSIRTLVASVPQYLGFLYINPNTTPNSICLTKAGFNLLNEHRNSLEPIKNLIEDKEKIITESKSVLLQMEKLQITNPIIAKDCEDIFVFPFRATIKLLLELEYIDREEIAYFLFKLSDESEIDLKIREIKNFRALSTFDRNDLISAFKKTHLGNISLVKASSASYFENICKMTGIIESFMKKANNCEHVIPALRVKNDYKDYCTNLFNIKYKGIRTYDYKENLELWIDYIGDPERLYPPLDMSISNNSNEDYFVKIIKDEITKEFIFIESGKIHQYPIFIDEKYTIEVIDQNDGSKVHVLEFTPTYDNKILNLDEITKPTKNKLTTEEIASQLLEHSNSKNFNTDMLNKLEVIKKCIGIDKTEDKSLRGAHYEYLFYQLLSNLKECGMIDDVIWNGKVGKYGLPVQSPGGKTGTVDMIFIKDNVHYVLELTTIKSKSGQEKAEAISVPDHIKLYSQSIKEFVRGIYSAPLIHDRITAMMKTLTEETYNIPLSCIEDKKLVESLIDGSFFDAN